MKDDTKEKALKQFAELVIEKLEKVSSDWKQPWFNRKTCCFPQNLDGREYSGSNNFLLTFLTDKKGYQLPVYMTYMQAQEKGISVMKGEKSFPVVYWNFIVKDKDNNKIPYEEYKQLTEEEQKEYTVTPYLKTYPVFNVEQTNIKEVFPDKWDELMKRFDIPELRDENGMFRHEALDNTIEKQSWICPIEVKESNGAFYSIGGKKITVPLKGQFVDGESFYSTLLHEMAHSTGAEEHLNRKFGKEFGDSDYSSEELIAELTSATCGQNLGLSTHLREENVKYIKNWLSALGKDTKFIYTLLKEVAKASNLIQDKVLGNAKELSDFTTKNVNVNVNYFGKKLNIDLSEKKAVLVEKEKSYDLSGYLFGITDRLPTNKTIWTNFLRGAKTQIGTTQVQLMKSPVGYSVKQLSHSKTVMSAENEMLAG